MLLFVIPLTVLTHLHNPAAAVVRASNRDGAAPGGYSAHYRAPPGSL